MTRTLSQRVADSRDRAIQLGARRLSVMLTPAQAEALAQLMDSGYAPSANACVGRAVMEAIERVRQSR